MPAWLPWAFVVIFSGAGYQISAKLIAGKLPLFVYTAIVGFTVLALSLSALALQGGPNPSLINIPRRTLLMPAIVGAFAFGIELGFFLLYTNNAPLAIGRIVTMSGSGLLLLAVGILFFHEHITPNQTAGIALTILGLALIAWK